MRRNLVLLLYKIHFRECTFWRNSNNILFILGVGIRYVFSKHICHFIKKVHFNNDHIISLWNCGFCNITLYLGLILTYPISCQKVVKSALKTPCVGCIQITPLNIRRFHTNLLIVQDRPTIQSYRTNKINYSYSYYYSHSRFILF